MATYLRFFEQARECAGCGLPAGPGVGGVTEDMLPGRLLPVCTTCLHSLDERLWRVVILRQCFEMTVRLVAPDKEPAQLAEEVRAAWEVLLDFLPELPATEEPDSARIGRKTSSDDIS